MALHEVQLKGYSVRPGNLSLGTFDSYGIEQLHVTLDDTWSGLAVTATFNPPEGEPVERRVPENGLIDVPAEATADAGTGTIVYCGVANGVQRITKTQGYNVLTHGNVGTTVPFDPSEPLATQVLQAALNAEKNSAEAKRVADDLRNDAANGKFNGKDGAKGDKGDTGPQGPVGPQGPQGEKGKDAEIPEDYPQIRKDVSQLKEDIDDLENLVAIKSPNLFDTSRLVNKSITDTGAVVTNQNTCALLNIPIMHGQSIIFNGFLNRTDLWYGFVYNSRGELISRFGLTNHDSSYAGDASWGHYGNKYTAVDGAEYFSIYTLKATFERGTKHQLEYGDTLSEYKPYGALSFKYADEIDKIQADVDSVKGDTTALQKRQNVLVGSETGNPVSCDDAFAAPLCGLNVYGKSTQDGTPSPDNPVPIISAGDGGSVAVRVTGKNLIQPYTKNTHFAKNGVTMDYDMATQLVHVYGTSTDLADLYDGLQQIPFHVKSAVTMSLAEVSGNIPASVTIQYSDFTTLRLSCTASKPYSTGAFDRPDAPGFLRFVVNVPEGLTLDFSFKVQLELGVTATTYEPNHKQTLTLSTPNGLPGIPVTSGGNYTDQNGQQWVCDEVDLERGVKVQRVNRLKLDDLSWRYEFTPTNKSDTFISDVPTSQAGTEQGYSLCQYAVFDGIAYDIEMAKSCRCYVWTKSATLQFKAGSGVNSVDAFSEWLKARPDASISYCLATPIETSLTPAEIAAYKALTAYAPDTVVQASDGAGVKLEYQRDVNIAIKKLEDAIASMTTT